MASIHSRSVQVCALGAMLVAAATLIPTRAHLQAQQPKGKALYDSHCAECHGPDGKGDGPAAPYLTPRPRDFTAGRYKIRSTETGSVPTDDDLVQSVRQGLYGTAMPAWDRVLSDGDISEVVQYLKTMSPQFATPPKVMRRKSSSRARVSGTTRCSTRTRWAPSGCPRPYPRR